MTHDVAIVGGSYAGLSAALPLARARRSVLVFDAGQRRNRFASASHGFFAHDGDAPGDMVRQAREQLSRYATVQWVDALVHQASGQADAFELRTANGAWSARRIVLATGVVDQLPDVPGLQPRWGRSVFHCPYCHGYELQQGRIGIIATGPESLHQALLLPEWGTVTLLLNGCFEPDGAAVAQLDARGVAIERAPVQAIVDEATVVLADGRRVVFAGLFTAPRTAPASALGQQLGCALERTPVTQHLQTDAMKQTSVPGVFACGDTGRAMGNVALAVGDGAVAGLAAHRSLMFGLSG